jgi:hypothetical protein
MSQRERRDLRIDELPANLSEALDALERDDLVRETLGEHICSHFLEAKREEWAGVTSSTNHHAAATDVSMTSTSGTPRIAQLAEAQAAQSRAGADVPQFADETQGVRRLVVQGHELGNGPA